MPHAPDNALCEGTVEHVALLCVIPRWLLAADLGSGKVLQRLDVLPHPHRVGVHREVTAVRDARQIHALGGNVCQVEQVGIGHAIHVLARAPRGSVLVCDAADFVAGYWGEVLTVAAEVACIVELVINGGVRDIAALQAHGFPVFDRGISVKCTVKATAPSIGKPFDFSGSQVSAGDLVVADEDGVIIIPAAAVAGTLLEGQKCNDKKARSMQKLREGYTTLELMGLATPEEHA